MESQYYWPELGQPKPVESRLFESKSPRHVTWDFRDDEAARAAFRQHRIKPAAAVRAWPVTLGPRAGTTRSSAMLTRAAYEKLRNAGLLTVECLLD